MILIVGSSNDDILYFESILKNKREVTLLNKYTAYTGEIFNQQIMLLKDMFSSYITSAIVSHVIEKYFAILVISVGTCQAYSSSLKMGDIVVAKHVMIGDVNLCDTNNVSVGQIPGFPLELVTSNEISNSIKDALSNRTFKHGSDATFISSNSHVSNKTELDSIAEEGKIFGETSNIVLSSEIGGIAIASILHDVPFAAVHVVGNKINNKSSIEDYVKVLDQYSNVGKAIVSVIGEIGRNDVLR